MRRFISVSVDVSDFDTDDLIDALKGRSLYPDEIAALVKIIESSGGFAPTVELDIAVADLLAGRRREALIHLERALGRQWIGVLTQ